MTVKLEPGMLIETNYSGPYRIESILRGCICEDWYDTIILEKPPNPRPPHIHIVCRDPDGKGSPSYLNDYDEETLKSFDKSYCGGKTELDHDYITILEQDRPIQKTLF